MLLKFNLCLLVSLPPFLINPPFLLNQLFLECIKTQNVHNTLLTILKMCSTYNLGTANTFHHNLITNTFSDFINL